jgi:hypothetical protein
LRSNWDLQLNAYGTDEARVQDGDLPTVIDRGTKWDSIVRHLKRHPAPLDRYAYSMIPDDDLLMQTRDINRLFEIAVEYDLSLAQPTLSIASYISYPILLRCPQFKLRYCNFLESQACCFRSSYLKMLLPMFEKYPTEWGIDLIWTMLMKEPAFCAALVDEVPMTHTRSGRLYNDLANKGNDPHRELADLTSRFTNLPRAMIVYGGVPKNGRRVGGSVARLLNGLYLLSVAHRSKLPFNTARMGAAMLLRIFTKMGYRPTQIHPADATTAALLGYGRLTCSSWTECDIWPELGLGVSCMASEGLADDRELLFCRGATPARKAHFRKRL